MNRTKRLIVALAMLLCIAAPQAALAAEDIPPMDELAIPDYDATPEEILTRQAVDGDIAVVDAPIDVPTQGAITVDGNFNRNIENAPALRSSTNEAIDVMDEEEEEAEETAAIADENVPLNDQVNTGRPLIWMPILGGLLMLSAVPLLIRKRT